MRTIEPERYLCYRTIGAVEIDGRLNDTSWKQAPWTNYFVDIEGERKPLPRFKTRVKMLWDDDYFYFAADMEEPHVWTTIVFHDQVIFHENDFEIFIDPDGDNHEYYELEINALNTFWDLFLRKPYKDGGPVVHTWEVPGLKTAVSVDGTINDPRDSDRGWSVEFAIPWNVLAEHAHRPCPPRHGDQWRVNFSRVEWEHETYTSEFIVKSNPPVEAAKNEYRIKEGIPCDNWVWSPQGLVNMHCPEMWGYVQFSTLPPGQDEFCPDDAAEVRIILHEIYYAQKDFHKKNNHWAKNCKELGLDNKYRDRKIKPPIIEFTNDGYSARVEIQLPDGTTQKFSIRQDSLFREE